MAECFHCADTCEDIISFDTKTFCCLGCKTVYELLKTNHLENYYHIDTKPGIRPNVNNTDKFNFLNNEQIVDRIIDFQDHEIIKVNLFIPAIHCSSCIWLLENLHKIHKGVHNSQVNFVKKEAVITINKADTSLKALFEFLDQLGYSPNTDTQSTSSSKKNKKLVLQLAIAGFCFGNIMLFSFPEYLMKDGDFVKEFRGFFSAVILALSLPIILYSAKDYLTSAYKAIKYKNINLDVPISIGIIALYGKSLFDIITGAGPGYMDSFSGFIFFLLIGKWFQSKTYEALSFERDYQSYFPLAVQKITGKEKIEITPIEEIKKGDVIIIRNEEIIPTDGMLLSDSSKIDYSFVTGESQLNSISQNDKIYAGGKHQGTSVKILVEQPVNQSYLTQLWNKDQTKESSKFESIIQGEKLSKVFTLSVILIAIISGITWAFIDPRNIVNIITSILIVACPCALALANPFTYGNTIRYFGRAKFYFKNTTGIEEMNVITDIVFDKTGTITSNNENKIKINGAFESSELNLVHQVSKHSNHPLSVQLAHYLSQCLSLEQQVEVDFNSFDEFLGKGIVASTQFDEIKIGSSKLIPSAQNQENATVVHVEINGQLIGSFLFENKYREGIQDELNELSKFYTIHLLTGDNEKERENLIKLFPVPDNIKFNQLPEQKKKYIESLISNGKKVMMIGDGLNDAGALISANLGVVVSDNIYNFSPACDAILDANQLKQLNTYFKLANKSKQTLHLSYWFSILYNTIGLAFAVSGILTPLIAAILMPISSISIVILTSIKTNFNAKKILDINHI